MPFVALETVAHQSENTENDQVARDDIVEKFREDQDADTGGQCDQGRNFDLQGHDNAPWQGKWLVNVSRCSVPMPGSPGQASEWLADAWRRPAEICPHVCRRTR